MIRSSMMASAKISATAMGYMPQPPCSKALATFRNMSPISK